MRTRSVCWGVMILAWLTGSSMAQPPASPPSPPTYPAEMAIIVPEVEVRSGPTKQHYATAKLRQGERVVVESECKDQPGWAMIKPPTGSFSWIRQKFVKQTDARTGFVQAPNNGLVAVMPGSSVVEQALNVESNKVPSGCQVMILDKPFHWEGENWLPIQPTPKEVRYIPLSALRTPPPSVAVASGNGFPTSVGGDLLAKAEQAYAAGNLDLARQLYRQAADKSAEPQKSYALNRLASLSTNGASPVSTSSRWQPPTNGQVPFDPSKTAPTATPASQSSNFNVPGPSMTSMKAAQWSGWGYLRRAGFEKDGQPVYVLENRQGQPLIYAVEQASAPQKLSKMIGRLVCLYGPIAYRSEDYPRVQYMVASWYATP